MVMGKLKKSSEEIIIFKVQNDRKLIVEQMGSFASLGVLITIDESTNREVDVRLVNGERSVRVLVTILMRSKAILQMQRYCRINKINTTNGCETWTINKNDEDRR